MYEIDEEVGAAARYYDACVVSGEHVYEDGDDMVTQLTVGARGGGPTFTYEARCNMPQLNRELVEAARLTGEDREVGWSLKKMWKKTKKIARKVTKSKVWKLAEKALVKVGPALPPPYGPALLAAGSAMKVTRALIKAKKLAKSPKRSHRAKARRIVRKAQRVAKRHPSRLRRAAAAKALVQAPKLYLTLAPS